MIDHIHIKCKNKTNDRGGVGDGWGDGGFFYNRGPIFVLKQKNKTVVEILVTGYVSTMSHEQLTYILVYFGLLVSYMW